MRVLSSVAAMRRLAGDWRAHGIPIAFVPTMGFLHAGHLSLMARARQACGRDGRVVTSIYVNPTQFGPNEDFSSYPRDLEHDSALCRSTGVDALFAPDDSEMYPAGFSAYVVEDRLSQSLEGASRPTHFRGVTTVVAKLFHIVEPDMAVFGEKDFQQAAIIKRMARDLNFPVKIVVSPTVRESDGLALSSRNKYLTEEERAQATILWRALQAARAAVAKKPVASAALRGKIERLIATQPAAKPDYVAFVDGETLEPVALAAPGTRMALAVRFGKTRLIDNARL